VSARVEFKLDMPGRGSWDGRWSGEGRLHVALAHLKKASKP
jgi:hypothetical protein